MEFVLSAAISYLIGSISFSYLIAKKLAGIDIRAHGSGNAGATNTLRVLGKGPAIVVLVLDMLKGMAAMQIAWYLSGGSTVAVAFAGIFAIIGHNWPVFFQFRGGKGIATTLGVALMLSWKAFVVSGILCLLVILVTRYVSLGSLVFVTALPVTLWIFTGDAALFGVSLFVTLLGYVRHYSNIRNLLAGKERKLGDPSSRPLK
ncbi:glycerol-3-phosphate 1-O-acyltransferase PlsY [Brevibacillus sp. SYP-B805]|uniref:glycerol-3-phosphate 1-O-acyltransferase PlsY n=1 Tax=Brevibacillus sp. SYP-B805 TaxID=1578199 RepID=UPI0013E9CC65|nr:glycerol-3-phosphate 1-O-acyltransferase PlsY [Brevibacillus sp. SYP-B805]NGQ94591.1 glycerol-3-phosphate 1-O-acyltransferase PlsY [Brevibacillus sp. SYP-B805]